MITPNELKDHQLSVLKIETFEKTIDASLKDKCLLCDLHSGSKILVNTQMMPPRMAKALCTKYEEAGWHSVNTFYQGGFTMFEFIC